jgi:hypothetical protein
VTTAERHPRRTTCCCGGAAGGCELRPPTWMADASCCSPSPASDASSARHLLSPPPPPDPASSGLRRRRHPAAAAAPRLLPRARGRQRSGLDGVGEWAAALLSPFLRQGGLSTRASSEPQLGHQFLGDTQPPRSLLLRVSREPLLHGCFSFPARSTTVAAAAVAIPHLRGSDRGSPAPSPPPEHRRCRGQPQS